MKRFLIRAAIGCSTFILGIACAGIWISKPSPVTQIPSNKCVPVYDAALLNQKLNEIDDPQLFRAFQELPLYAMPDCVDEAYSLTWIPSFHQPVLVRVWRVGDEFFMIGKSLDSRGWSEFGFGNVKESNERSLTKSEWRDITNLLTRAGYWELPETADDTGLLDGAVWLLDGLKSKEYHWVRRRVPDDQYAEICKRLIQLSGLETAHSLYLP